MRLREHYYLHSYELFHNLELSTSSRSEPSNSSLFGVSLFYSVDEVLELS